VKQLLDAAAQVDRDRGSPFHRELDQGDPEPPRVVVVEAGQP
jgi:hypothetical protein